MARLGRSQPFRPKVGRLALLSPPPPPLAGGTASFANATPTQANLSCTAASGGTLPYTYQWKRATTSSIFSNVPGATGTTLADTTISAGVGYYWYREVTDALSHIAASTVVFGNSWAAAVVLGAVGDSIYAGFGLSAGQDPVTQCVSEVPNLTAQRIVTLGSNSAISNTTTADWLPTSGTNDIQTAVAAFNAASATDVIIMLGTNDGRAGVSAATYGANMATIVAYLLANVPTLLRVWPSYPIWSPNTVAGSIDNAQLTQSYQTQIDSLVNGTTVLHGDRLGWQYFATHDTLFQPDGVHPSVAGAAALGLLVANAMDAGLNGTSPPPPAGGTAGARIFEGF